MKLKILFFCLISIALINCNESKKLPENMFTLSGTIKGENTKDLKVGYTDIADKYIYDTIKIVDGKFEIKGFINGTSQMQIVGNAETNNVEDPNRIHFFLNSIKMTVDLVENDFQNTTIKGSDTQKEFEKLSMLSKPFDDEIELINKESNELSKKPDWESNDELLKKMEFYDSEWERIQEKRKDIKWNFVKSNPNSYLSAYYLLFYDKDIEYKELKEAYSNFNEQVKNSTYGIAVNKDLKIIEKSQVGKFAPDFILTDFNGNELQLSSFKGKYVLLDFWATWCEPCVAQLPIVKNLFKNYNDKGLEIISLSLDRYEENWKAGVKKHELQLWNNVYIGLANQNKEDGVYKNYAINGIPMYILINSQGIIAGRYFSIKDESLVEDLKKKLDTI